MTFLALVPFLKQQRLWRSCCCGEASTASSGSSSFLSCKSFSSSESTGRAMGCLDLKKSMVDGRVKERGAGAGLEGASYMTFGPQERIYPCPGDDRGPSTVTSILTTSVMAADCVLLAVEGCGAFDNQVIIMP